MFDFLKFSERRSQDIDALHKKVYELHAFLTSVQFLLDEITGEVFPSIACVLKAKDDSQLSGVIMETYAKTKELVELRPKYEKLRDPRVHNISGLYEKHWCMMIYSVIEVINSAHHNPYLQKLINLGKERGSRP